MDSLIFDLPIGLQTASGDAIKTVELLRTNGVAEKVFVTKLSERPYTWQGNVLSVGIKSIGDIEIGAEVRRQSLKDNAVTIPTEIKNLTLADVNTLLLEFHSASGGRLQVLRQAVTCGHRPRPYRLLRGDQGGYGGVTRLHQDRGRSL